MLGYAAGQSPGQVLHSGNGQQVPPDFLSQSLGQPAEIPGRPFNGAAEYLVTIFDLFDRRRRNQPVHHEDFLDGPHLDRQKLLTVLAFQKIDDLRLQAESFQQVDTHDDDRIRLVLSINQTG